MDKLVLFDIDNTLIEGSRGHKIAFSGALKKIYGVDANIDIIDYYGMTDQQIIIEVLKKHGLDEQMIKSKLEECMKAMVIFFNRVVDGDEIIILDGVRELLEELDGYNILMGLVTGNLEPIARGKLKKVGLNHHFKIGGFGNNDINRANLVKIAIRRAGKKFNFKFDNNVFVIGDAPKEIKAGKEAGVKTIGVTTGIYSKEQLKDAGADFILEHLKDKDRILKIIEGKT